MCPVACQIHNTAFATKWLNKSLAHCVGFIVFRGANWYWYFHWNHHRFTNDPERDPELSGSTVDRSDPTLTEGGTAQCRTSVIGSLLLLLLLLLVL